MEFPDRPEVGVGAVVLEGQNILLIKRKYPPDEGKWSIPGGHVKLGEPLFDAAIRELKEETDIEGIPEKIIDVGEIIVDDRGKVRYHYVVVDILVSPVTPLKEAKPSGDATDVISLPLRKTLELDLSSSTRMLIQKLIKR
jgi:ADP-ribose pyrophosphatase YjhB (NUDIX family)